MAVLKNKDVKKMNIQDTDQKLKELKIELIKSKVNSQKSSKIRPKEIKRAIARVLTQKNLLNKGDKTKNKHGDRSEIRTT